MSRAADKRFTIRTPQRPLGSDKDVTVVACTSGVRITDNQTGESRFVTVTALSKLAQGWKVTDGRTELDFN